MASAMPNGQPPPTYAASQPQILVAPLPDAASFFCGNAVQGEVFVKGLGEEGGRRGVKHLSVKLYLVNRLPSHPDIELHEFPDEIIWPSQSLSSTSTSRATEAFGNVHRFIISLPQSSSPSSDHSLPGTLNLSDAGKGEVKWSLRVTLSLLSGNIYEDIQVEGTPQEMVSGTSESGDTEVESKLDKLGVITRMLVEDPSPRLGSLLRLGVEFRPKAPQRTGVAALASSPDPAHTLRSLRRVRVELYRLVHIHQPSDASSSTGNAESREHLTLLHATGKSLRYPGSSHPPLRVLFTLPTAQLGATADQTWGETSTSVPYHTVTFFVRVSLGFGALAEVAPEEMRDFAVEQQITIRPKAWKERVLELDNVGMTEEEIAQEAYRRKGLDRVGQSGTYRPQNEDGPPDFEAGPSSLPTASGSGAGGLPTFLESEAQAAGEIPAPVSYDDAVDAPTVGRRNSLRGELGSWVEYDGYETFSVAPPSVHVSFGASGSMDPPHPDDEDVNVAGGLAARLGLSTPAGGVGGMELMEQLGLGEGTRVIDLQVSFPLGYNADKQDDLPPGIDEPSLPALPTFSQSTQSPGSRYRPIAQPAPSLLPGERSHDVSPPSFAASEAAHIGLGINSRPTEQVVPRNATRLAVGHAPVTPPPPIEVGEGRGAPPGYFGGVISSVGPPAYS